MIKHLDHLNLSVRDFDETASWYRRVFGFEIVQEDRLEDGTRWGVLRAGEALLCVYEYGDLAFETPAQVRGRGLHSVAHFGLRVTDQKRWEETIAREDVDVNYGGAVHWPHSTAWYVNDPTGYEIEVAHWNDDTVQFDPR